MTQPADGAWRIGPGHVDSSRSVHFTFAGTVYTGHPGDTLASALLAHGVHYVASSVRLGRPRGIVSAGPEEPSALVQIDEPFPDPMQTATTLEVFDGLVAHGLAGQGRLADWPDPARYDTVHAHADVVVVGAGPAGLVAARDSARAGARVVLVDEQPAAGGSLLGHPAVLDGQPALAWVQQVIDELQTAPDVRILLRCTAFGAYDDGLMLALERRTDHLGMDAPAHVARQRVWRIRARHLIVATGAHERPLVFADNDRPGIMLAGAARTYLHRYGVLVGRRVVVATIDDSAYATAVDLHDAGASVEVVDAREAPPQHCTQSCDERGIGVRVGAVVTGTTGAERINAAIVQPHHGVGADDVQTLPCDLLAVCGGWNPVVQLVGQAGGHLQADARTGTLVPADDPPDVSAAGAAAGRRTLGTALASGQAAAIRAHLGGHATADMPVLQPLPELDPEPTETDPLVLWTVPGDAAHQFVDLQRDATVADIRRAVVAGMTGIEHIKRWTTIGTAHDQGKTSGVLAAGVLAQELGTDLGALGHTTYRPPYAPVAMAALAGRNRGVLSDPVRVTALHAWHVTRGAVFEDVGQWLRPWCYPLDGEPPAQAVLRECAAVRTAVALMDGSTLGKIAVVGPDSGELLDRLYTNMMSTLQVGRARYGVLCGVDGMVFDDGTVTRVDEQEYLLTTTTGNAAAVLDLMDEWLQTEWPDLRVHLTSVTEQWATIPLVGPLSRVVLAAVAPDLDVSADGFGFMSWRDAIVAGVQARICRISFSGELAYEINVCAFDAMTVWEALIEAGERHGITPYGTEAMHVLRAEKGFPIVGQDTDGTVTPQDLGMSWVVSKKKADYLGRRSHARASTTAPDRKHLVGLVCADPAVVLEEGAALVLDEQVLDGILPAPPVPMVGHVTSSYRSASLGRGIALALLRSGRDRHGETVWAVSAGAIVPVTVTGTVAYDPDGERRDG